MEILEILGTPVALSSKDGLGQLPNHLAAGAGSLRAVGYNLTKAEPEMMFAIRYRRMDHTALGMPPAEFQSHQAEY